MFATLPSYPLRFPNKTPSHYHRHRIHNAFRQTHLANNHRVSIAIVSTLLFGKRTFMLTHRMHNSTRVYTRSYWVASDSVPLVGFSMPCESHTAHAWNAVADAMAMLSRWWPKGCRNAVEAMSNTYSPPCNMFRKGSGHVQHTQSRARTSNNTATC